MYEKDDNIVSPRDWYGNGKANKQAILDKALTLLIAEYRPFDRKYLLIACISILSTVTGSVHVFLTIQCVIGFNILS